MIFLAITAISLSFWQISRAVEKKNFIEKKSERGKEILSLNSEFTKINSLDAQNWDQRRIKVLGYWVPNTTIYLDNRSHNATSGVHVLSALKLKENDSILWVNRGWGIKPPGFIEKSKKFIDGKKYLPYEIKDIVEIEGIAHIDLMKRIELTSDLSILRNGRLWQNIDWSSLYQLLESQKSLDFDIVWPFILWQTSKTSDGLIRSIPKVKVDVSKHLGYAVQWFLLSCLAIFFAWRLGGVRD